MMLLLLLSIVLTTIVDVGKNASTELNDDGDDVFEKDSAADPAFLHWVNIVSLIMVVAVDAATTKTTATTRKIGL